MALLPALPSAARSPLLVLLVGWLLTTGQLAAAAPEAAAGWSTDERSDCRRVFFPLDPQTPGADGASAADWLGRARRSAEAGNYAAAFVELMRAHHADPAEAEVRRMLALPPDAEVAISVRPGRAAPSVLRWRPGTYLQAQTPHFAIYSAADEARTRQVAAELERFYWIWAQVFFPLWEGRAQVREALRGGPAIGRSGRLLRVVLFADRDAYTAALRPHVPGIEQSTGFYSDPQRTTFLIHGATADDLATRHHELTHQLLREATGSQLRGRGMPGDGSDFWLVEGVACYMESLRFASTYGWVGGWESPRLQFARYRWLAGGDRLRLSEIADQGRLQVQQRSDLPRWYSYAAAYSHLLIDGGPAAQRDAMVGRLRQMYAAATLATERSAAKPPVLDLTAASEAMPAFLNLDDAALQTPDPAVPLAAICLGRTAVTSAGLEKISPQARLDWLDLSHLEVDSRAVQRLLAGTARLQQLALEATAVDDAVAQVLVSAQQLRELDLSFTEITDVCVERLSDSASLETLWLTGTAVTDATVQRMIEDFPALQSADVQRTAVTPAAVAELKRARPNLRVNPLTLAAPSSPSAGDASR